MEKIGIIGIGRLGLCFALNLEKVGFTVVGVDINESYVNSLNSKTFNSSEPFVNEYLINASNLDTSTDYSLLMNDEISLIYIIVPTPSNVDGSFSHVYIDDAIDRLLSFGKSNVKKHLVIGATTMPGYCEELAKRIEKYNYTLTYNPEFIAQGSIIHDQQFPDQILIGEGDEVATEFLKVLYGKMCKSSPEILILDRTSAEIAKLATNCFLTMKISFANAIGDLATKLNANPIGVLNAVGSDKRIGKKYMNYGFGFGGPCFPRDNKAIQKVAEAINYPLLLSESTVRVNELHLEFQFQQLIGLNQDSYDFESVTYKPNTDIIEESQQLALALKLAFAGKKVILRNSKHIQSELENLYPNLFLFE
jgi:nucleotide sugar dehydrogenase